MVRSRLSISLQMEREMLCCLFLSWAHEVEVRRVRVERWEEQHQGEEDEIMSNESMLLFAMGLASLQRGFRGAGWCGRAADPCSSSFAVTGEYVGNQPMVVCVVRARACRARWGAKAGPEARGSGCSMQNRFRTFLFFFSRVHGQDIRAFVCMNGRSRLMVALRV